MFRSFVNTRPGFRKHPRFNQKLSGSESFLTKQLVFVFPGIRNGKERKESLRTAEAHAQRFSLSAAWAPRLRFFAFSTDGSALGLLIRGSPDGKARKDSLAAQGRRT